MTEGYYVLRLSRVEDEFLPLPSDFDHDLLRRVLFRWATRFTSDERMQLHLVEKTIDEILEELPALTDDHPIDAALLARMRRVALREFGADAQPAEKAIPKAYPTARGKDQ